MAEREDTVALSMTRRLPDGGALMHRWYIHPADAENLANQLGPPARETLASPEAAEEINAHVTTVAGIVTTTQEPHE